MPRIALLCTAVLLAVRGVALAGTPAPLTLGAAACSSAPRNCRNPVVARGSKLILKDRTPDDHDMLKWNWKRGRATTKAIFGNPVATTSYALCLYQDGVLVQGNLLPNGSDWTDVATGYRYRALDLMPDGILSGKLREGLTDGFALVKIKGKGALLELPDPTPLTGVLDVQLQRLDDPHCWGATFTPPFHRNTGGVLIAYSDTPPPPVPLPLWSEIHQLVVSPVCSSCHGVNGGLSGLADCNTAYASLVSVASAELPTMNRVEPGDPTTSWMIHKLDGDQAAFTAQCTGMSCGSQMPPGSPLSTEVRDAIRTWIMNGAANDCP